MKVFYFIVLVLGTTSCQKNNNTTSNSEILLTELISSQANIPFVNIQVLKDTTFNTEIISQGKEKTLLKADIHFSSGGKIKNVYITSGQYVKKNQLLLELDDSDLKIQLEKLDLQLERKQIDLQNQLISLGYNPEDTLNIPQKIYHNALIESGIPELIID